MVASADVALRESQQLQAGGGEASVLARRRFRGDLISRGGATASRCFQCATCSSVCELSTNDHLFPRRQMLLAQWGMEAAIAADPAIWLCHQCNDCSVRCPRDARPGDVMQTLRSKTVEAVATPRAFGRLVAMAAYTWPVLLGVPVAIWVLLVGLTTGFVPGEGPLIYETVVPHWLIYVVNFPATAFAAVLSLVGARKLWRMWGRGVTRRGNFWRELIGASIDIMLHRRFSSCETARPRKRGHFLLFWGFAGAAATSGFLVVALYGFNMPPPLPQGNWMKILGNLSAVFLVLGVISLLAHRFTDNSPAGNATAFDNFFLGIVVLLVVTGVFTEIGRIFFDPNFAIAIYLLHLGTTLSLFLTFPYSKFAHLMYRALAMVHQRMVEPKSDA